MVNRLFAVVLVLAIAVGLMATARGQSAGTATPAASPTASPLASPVASPVGRSVSVSRSVTIQLNDGWFDPAYVESTNGHDLTITLVNAGSRRHSFRIDRYHINVSLAPGEKKTVVIRSPRLGDYTYYSDAPGDEGMQGQLTFYI